MYDPEENFAHDILRGASEIAAFLRTTRRAVYHLAATSRLPIFRLGSRLCARKSAILKWVAAQELRLPIGMKPSPET